MAKRVKLPKRIAGVKVPKAVRKGPVVDFLNSSGGQLLLAEVLAVIAGAYAVKKTDPDSPVGEFIRNPVKGARKARRSLREANNGAATRLSHAFSEAVQAFRNALTEDGASYEADSGLFEDPELAPGGEDELTTVGDSEQRQGRRRQTGRSEQSANGEPAASP